MHYTNTVQY